MYLPIETKATPKSYGIGSVSNEVMFRADEQWLVVADCGAV
jgi:hypothetical protein